MALLGFMPSADAIAPGSVLKRMEASWSEIHRLQMDLWQSARDVLSEETRYYAGAFYLDRSKDFRMDYQEVDSNSPLAATEAAAWVQSASFEPQDIFRGNPDFLWHYNRREGSVTKQFLTESGLPPVLQMLAGARQFIAEEFEGYYYIAAPIPEEEVLGRMTYLLQLKPKGPGKEERVRYDLWIDRENYLPARMRVISSEQQLDVYFMNAATEKPLPENIFTIVPAPGVRFIDRTTDY
jgi:outer membrane lipoprotein-sorting protein